MDAYLLWAVVGMALIIIEMLTGTFYLLVLGLAALSAAAAAWFGGSFWVQAVLIAAVSVAGVLLVKRYRGGSRAGSAMQGPGLDIGQAVTLDEWISEADGLARVRYRNAQWEAQVSGERSPESRVFYIHAVEGNTLRVSSVRPH